MTRGLWRLGVALLSAVLSVLIALVVARLGAFVIGDVGGVVYLYFATPLIAALAAGGLLALLPGSMGAPQRSVVVLFVVAGASLAVHSLALRARAIGGSYELPSGFDAAAKSERELEGLVWDGNYVVADAALVELGRRGHVGADALVRVLDEARRRIGPSFVDASLTRGAVKLLAERRDQRAIPVLEAMLRSEWAITGTVFDAENRPHRTLVYTTRQFAVRVLAEAFGIESQVEVKKAVP